MNQKAFLVAAKPVSNYANKPKMIAPNLEHIAVTSSKTRGKSPAWNNSNTILVNLEALGTEVLRRAHIWHAAAAEAGAEKDAKTSLVRTEKQMRSTYQERKWLRRKLLLSSEARASDTQVSMTVWPTTSKSNNGRAPSTRVRDNSACSESARPFLHLVLEEHLSVGNNQA